MDGTEPLGAHAWMNAAVREHRDWMLRLALRILRNLADAEDAVQEALVWVWEWVRGGEVIDSIRAVLARFTVRACHRVRLQSSALSLTSVRAELEEPEILVPDDVDTTSEVLTRIDSREELEAKVKMLQGKFRGSVALGPALSQADLIVQAQSEWIEANWKLGPSLSRTACLAVVRSLASKDRARIRRLERIQIAIDENRSLIDSALLIEGEGARDAFVIESYRLAANRQADWLRVNGRKSGVRAKPATLRRPSLPRVNEHRQLSP